MEKGAQVECYSGSRYGERPLRFLLGDEWHVVKETDASWRTPSAVHFRVRTEDGDHYELTYDEREEQWHVLATPQIDKEH
jgi:hypothetical protein